MSALSEEKDLYFVAVKIFLEKNGKLLILKDNYGDWDLPGGRIKKGEFEIPLHQVIHRKMSEELGNEIEYVVAQPIVFIRHERQEVAPGNPTVRIFAVGYRAILESGEIRLSLRHPDMKWVDIATFDPTSYFTGGWLKGVQEYLALTRSI